VRTAIRPASNAVVRALTTRRYEPPSDLHDGDADPVLNPERFCEVLDATGGRVRNLYVESVAVEPVD
jgi:hypothetical protein